MESQVTKCNHEMQEAQACQKKAETLAADVQKEVDEKLAEMTHQLDKAIQDKI